MFGITKGESRWKSSILVCFLLGNLIFAILLGIRELGGLQSLELKAYDLSLRLAPTSAPDERIALVGVTEQDIRSFGYPVPDEVLAKVLERLTEYQAATIGVDIYRDIPVPPGHNRLDRALRNNSNIIWITKLSEKDGRVPPPTILEGSAQIGFNDISADPGGIIRRGLLFMDDGKENFTSFPLQLVLHYLAPKGVGLQADPVHPEYVRLGRTTIKPFERNDGGYMGADAGGYQFLLDYKGMPNRFTRYSVGDLLAGKVPTSSIKNRIVIVGMTANSVNDYFYTPFGGNAGSGQRIFGIELHGSVASQLARLADGDTPIRVPDKKLDTLWIWFWVILGSMAGYFTRSAWRFAFWALVVPSLLVVAYYFAGLNKWWIPLGAPLAGYISASSVAAIYMASHLHVQSRFIKNTFGRYLSKEVVEQLLEAPGGLNLGGQSLFVTVVFTDLRGFSAISERLHPEQVVVMLNNYLKEMTRIIFKYGGNINEFMGDGILILFGAPLVRADDANRAIACSIEMQIAMGAVNELNRNMGLPDLEMGIGINTGTVVAGNVGSDMRAKYAVVGSHVNLASRVETLTVGGQILATDATLKCAQDKIVIVSERAVQFKGISEPVTIYELGGIEGSLNISLPQEQMDFITLARGIPALFGLIDGKQTLEIKEAATITQLCNKGAVLASSVPLEPYSNIRLILESTFSAGTPVMCAKILRRVDYGSYEVRFTSVPLEAHEKLNSLFALAEAA